MQVMLKLITEAIAARRTRLRPAKPLTELASLLRSYVHAAPPMYKTAVTLPASITATAAKKALGLESNSDLAKAMAERGYRLVQVWDGKESVPTYRKTQQ